MIELLQHFADVIIHLDKYLDGIIQTYGNETYFLLFAIIFAETGLVVTPFLPGDSLLFAAGAISAKGSLNVFYLFLMLSSAAIIGDTINYHIGKYLGPKVFKEKSRFFKIEYLRKTEKFYAKHGPITIILARFIPIIRTFAPFVAGIGQMHYLKFLSYNVIGGVVWISLFLFAGYFFGNIDFVKENFSLVILAIILISVLPAVIEIIKNRSQKKKPDSKAKSTAKT